VRRPLKRVPAIFFRTEAGGEPVRGWLKSSSREDRKAIGDDIQKAEYAWPIGMPLTRPMGDGLHEIRTELSGNRIARVFFYISGTGNMVLLHGIIKKSRRTPNEDLDLARRNKRAHERKSP
jgi:phage-related protein